MSPAGAVIARAAVGSDVMADSVLDRETLLDVSVNIIPLAIILFFVVLILAVSPWPPNPLVVAVSIMLHVVPFVSLAVLTYIAAHYI